MPSGWIIRIASRLLQKDNVTVTASAADINTLTGVAGGGVPASPILNARPRINADVAGAGTIQSDAAALLEGFTVGTGANGTVGWRLPPPVAPFGQVVIFKGTTAGVAKMWPNVGAQINGVGTDTAMSFASGLIPATLIAKSATQWYTLPLVPS